MDGKGDRWTGEGTGGQDQGQTNGRRDRRMGEGTDGQQKGHEGGGTALAHRRAAQGLLGSGGILSARQLSHL